MLAVVEAGACQGQMVKVGVVPLEELVVAVLVALEPLTALTARPILVVAVEAVMDMVVRES
jgi:hypothetical protein